MTLHCLTVNPDDQPALRINNNLLYASALTKNVLIGNTQDACQDREQYLLGDATRRAGSLGPCQVGLADPNGRLVFRL